MTAQIAVVGTGYVGLTTGAYLARLGHYVVCADIVREKVEGLSRGEVPIHEAGLDELVREGLDSGRLRFVVGAPAAITGAEFVFLCLPTPQGADGSADMSYVEGVAKEIGPLLEQESVVINKSTVPVGSNRRVAQLLARDDVYVVSNPEFLREGTAVHDSLHPDRIVVGSDDPGAAMRVAALFEHLQAPLIVTDPATAETIKYASNAFLATKVSFINAVAHFCEMAGADVRDVVLGMGYDKRIGFEFLRPGPGYGGSCFDGRETVLVRRSGDPRLVTFEELFAEVERTSPNGWKVLSWRPGEPTPEFLPIDLFTARPYDGDLVEVSTKMGRRVRCTPDHPFIASDGLHETTAVRKLASELTTDDWLPIAQGYPFDVADDHPVAGLFENVEVEGLVAGAQFHDHRVPDAIWSQPEHHKRQFLAGLSERDRSWSLIRGGPNVVLELGTVSAVFADGVVRLLGDLGIVASIRVGRTSESTVDTYWVRIGGAEQIEKAQWLFPSPERAVIGSSINRRSKRIAPTGYRRLSKNAAWVRVTGVRPVPSTGRVYSVEVSPSHTVVVSNGLVASNCFPKDAKALMRMAEGFGYDFGFLKAVVDVNEGQYERVADKIEQMAGGTLSAKTVAALGLAFKARTDDTRESPAIHVIERLVSRGATVKAFDPVATTDRSDIQVCGDAYEALTGAHVAVVLTEWDEFRWLDFDKVHDLMEETRIVDARNLLDPAALRRKGFTYEGIGRI